MPSTPPDLIEGVLPTAQHIQTSPTILKKVNLPGNAIISALDIDPLQSRSGPLRLTEVHQNTRKTVTRQATTSTENDPSLSPDPLSGPRTFAGSTFLPFVRLFFEHMFVIMPVVARDVYLDPLLYTMEIADFETYCFLCALCAATIVQLDDSVKQPPPIHPTKRSDDCFVDECLRVRQTFDYVESVSSVSIMTSFFLFAYNGNHERHAKAWHYLQESITMAENLNMDDEKSYASLEPIEAQWRRRLYWLLFITERAYAVQRRKHTRLRAAVGLPAIFESEDPQMLNGFVGLANLFSAVDDSFVGAWRGSRRSSLCDEAWLAQTQRQLDASARATDAVGLTDTQRLDIDVTREWLHALAWQMGVMNGLIWGEGEGGMRLDYPLQLARKVIQITSSASAHALDSHGIGMEQKISDIAGCLADVLKCTGENSTIFTEGRHYLNLLLQQLAVMRGKESRYLKPLVSKMEGLMGYEMSITLAQPAVRSPITPKAEHYLSPTSFGASGPGWSMDDSMGMLRKLSMNGMMGLSDPSFTDAWSLRRSSGMVMTDQDSDAIQPWEEQPSL